MSAPVLLETASTPLTLFVLFRYVFPKVFKTDLTDQAWVRAWNQQAAQLRYEEQLEKDREERGFVQQPALVSSTSRALPAEAVEGKIVFHPATDSVEVGE